MESHNDNIPIKKGKYDIDCPNAVEQVKMLKHQLKQEETYFVAMQEFVKISSSESGEKFVEEYLKISPDCKELFSPLIVDKTSHPKQLILFWNAVEKILSVLSESSSTTDLDFSSAGHLLVCNILHNHMKILHSSLSPKEAKLRTSVLRCMSSMLAQGIQSVREFIKFFDFGYSFKQLKEAAKVSKKHKSECDARTCFIRFYLAFLVFGDVPVIKHILQQKDFSSLIINELHLDKISNILITLTTLDDKIVHEGNLLKTTKLLFFSQSALSKLVFLAKNNDEDVKNQSMKLLMTLCTDQKYGICFISKDNLYTGKLVNPVLLKFLISTKMSALTRENILKLTVETLFACPDIIVPYMNSLNLGLEPRLTDFWCIRISFLTKLWESIPKIPSICKVLCLKLENADFIMKLTIPHIMSRQLFSQGLKNKVNRVKQVTLQLLEISLSRCVELKNLLEEKFREDENISEMIESWVNVMIQSLPDVTPIIGIRQMSAFSEDKLCLQRSVTQKNKYEGEAVINQSDDEIQQQQKTLFDLLEMDILIDSSINCLNFYQLLKPGIITASGFNICKLLIFSRDVSEDVLNKSLNILLNETGGVQNWLQKKLNGPDNIFHLVLQIMICWGKSEQIIANSRKLLYKILNVVGQFNNYSFEIDIWIESLLSSVGNPNINSVDFIKEFAKTCLKSVNESFKYTEHLVTLFEEQETPSVRFDTEIKQLPSPLFFAILKNMTSETVIKHLIIPVMKELVVTHYTPGVFLKILSKEVGNECMEFYEELVCYTYQWMKGLELDTGFVLTMKSKDQLLLPLHQEDSTVMKDMAFKLLKLKYAEGDPVAIESNLKDIVCMKEIVRLLCTQCPILSSEAVAVFLSNAISFLYNSMPWTSSCEALVSLLGMLECLVRSLLMRAINVRSSLHFVCNLFDLPLFNNLVNLKNDSWKVFSQNILIICLEFNSEFQTTDIFNTCIRKLMNILAMDYRTDVSARKDAAELLCKFVAHLDPKLLNDVAKTIITSVLNHKLEEHLSNESFLNYTNILKRIKERCVHIDSLINKSCIYDFLELLHDSIMSKNKYMMDIILTVCSLSEFDGDICIDQKDYYNLLKCNDKVFTDFAVFISRCNFKIVKPDDPKSAVNFNEQFICDIKNDNIPVSDLCDNLLPLLVNVFNMSSGSVNHSVFALKLKSSIWKRMIERLGSKDNKFIVCVLRSLLQYMSDKEKIELMSEMKITIRSMPVNVVESMLMFCAKALSLLSDGLEQLICLVEIISTVIEAVINCHLKEDSYIIFINYLIIFIQLIPNFKTKAKSQHYQQLCSIWIKFVKKILKNKYEDHLSMSTVLVFVKILYGNKKFTKVCSLKIHELYELIMSHSKFFHIMFSENEVMSQNKVVLVKLISTLGELSNIYKHTMVPMLLVAYDAMLSEKDTCILSILHDFEKHDASLLSQFYPFVWGTSALSIFDEKDLKSSLLKKQSSGQVLQDVDKQKMLKSAIEFPIHLVLEKPQRIDLCKENYDPLFFLPLFVSLLQPECVVDCYQFMESGCLSFTFAATSSFNIHIRKIAYCILTRYNDHLDGTRFREKKQVTYLLMLLKHSVTEEYMRLPSVWTAFLIQYIYYILKPDHHLYTVLNNFILQKPTINVKELPVFLSLFRSCHIEHLIEHTWLLKLLADGLKDLSDYYLYKKYNVFKLLIVFYDTHMCEKNMKLGIHDIFIAACSLNTAAFDLVKTNSILSWIHFNVTKKSNINKSDFYKLLFTLTNTFQKHLNQNIDNNFDGKKVIIPKLLLHEISLICEHGLQNIDSLEYKDCIYISSIYSWIQCCSNYFGDMHLWQQDCNHVQFFEIITNLLLHTHLDDVDEKKISEIFCKIVLLMLEKDFVTVIFTSLKNKPWKKIYSFAKDKNMDNLMEVFQKLVQWSNKLEDKTLLRKIMQSFV